MRLSNNAHLQYFNSLKDRIKYYFNLKQMAAAKTALFNNLENNKVTFSLKSNFIRKKIRLILKAIYHNVPSIFYANALTIIFYKVLARVFDSQIKKIKSSLKSTLVLFDNEEIPAQFDLPYSDVPMVSIIIPVHNKYEYTHKCLYSIFLHTKDVAYEVIIGDDNSTDETIDLPKNIANIFIQRNAPGLGFLKNCNIAATRAKGKYLVFLNNDTVVQPKWLISLVNTIESDTAIGMVGSKLVYPDGFLQEAGGIIFKDGSGWNYGRLSFPDSPEYNYVKEVDYISGASILVSKILWDKIGGFDERFAPAYCEDSDLAFEIRKKGKKVIYQPESVVVHYEGISHGTDVNAGVKEYQNVNKEKFLAKWKKVLEQEQCPNQHYLFSARDRSSKRKTLLVIDHYAPEYDQDAGSKSTFQYIKLFVEMGLNVKFIGDNFLKKEPYTQTLQQMGVEVLYGFEYQSNWQQWVRDNALQIDYCFINRPHIAEKYIDFVKKNTKAWIIFYGHDLHFLREERQYIFAPHKKLLESAANWKKREFELFHKADVVLYPSPIEVKLIKEIDSSLNVHQLQPFIYQNMSANNRTHFDYGKRDLLFVGGFNHPPNIDAVLWFAKEIFPIVLKSLPNCKFIVVGSKVPKEIKLLGDGKIIIKGFVSDQELEHLYNTCRVIVAPLRYGAGIKGKIIEAIYHRNAVVTTAVGAEGIDTTSGQIVVADEAGSFAEAVVSLYKSDKRLEQIFISSPAFIAEYFSQKTIAAFLKKHIFT